MGKKNKLKGQKSEASQPARPLKKEVVNKKFSDYWVLGVVLVVTAICFWPMLNNQFTNWDDEFYVVQNQLLRGPDWEGIFSKPVVSNYHPLTVATLAYNYQVSELDPSSYLTLNLLLHLANTALVFFLVWKLSDRKVWVAFFTALLFGIHPMHVESVAWVSERKDVLYTLFFLLGIFQYLRYADTKKSINYWACFLLFGLSLLSKPAAIVFPVLLLLFDYWKGLPLNRKSIIEKIPFFIFAAIFAVITVKIQSNTAIAGTDQYPLWARLFFGCYTVMFYFVKFFVPFSLSAFYPYPSPDNLGLPVLLSPLFIVALLAALWYFRKNKLIIFGLLFFIINLLLVLQVVSIGGTIVSERYTYVPYIGLAFLAAMLLSKLRNDSIKKTVFVSSCIVVAVFGIITNKRVEVWKDSTSLWTDAISKHPEAPVPRTNRANHFIKLSAEPAYAAQKDALLKQALEDCTIALQYKPNHAKGYENRQNIYLRLRDYHGAAADAGALIKLEPGNRSGYYTRGTAFVQLNKPDSALADFNKSLSLSMNDDYTLSQRGSLLFNIYNRYDEAITDFTNAININPKGQYFLFRSYSYYRKGDLVNAKKDAAIAIQKGEAIAADYRQYLGL